MARSRFRSNKSVASRKARFEVLEDRMLLSIQVNVEQFIPGLEPRPGYHCVRGVALSPDETKLCAAYWTAGTASPVGGEPIGVYSTADYSLIDKMSYGGCHGGVVVSLDGRYVYTPSYYEGKVSRFDTASGNLRIDLAAGSWPSAIGLSPDGTRLVVGSGSDGRGYDMNNDAVCIYDVSAGAFTKLAQVALQDEPRHFPNIAFSPDSRYVYVPTLRRKSSHARLYEISVTAPYEVTRYTEIVGTTYLQHAVFHEGTVFVSEPDALKIWTVDVATMTVIDSVDLPHQPRNMAVHPSGEYLFVTHLYDSAVSVIDITAMSVVGTFAGMKAPEDIEFTSDGQTAYVGEYSTAEGGITVLNVEINQPPVADDDEFFVDEDTTLTVAAPGVLGNDTDADADPLSAVKVSDPQHGTLVLRSDGSFTYTPDENWNGTDTFAYKATDGMADSNVATVTITVNSVIDLVIDVKPGNGDEVDPINLGAKGRLPIAILTTHVDDGEIDTFDATSLVPKLDADTLDILFNDSGDPVSPVHYAVEDVDGDGDLDLVLHFLMQDIRPLLEDDHTGLTLSMEFTDDDPDQAIGVDLSGSDLIRIVPPKDKGKGEKK